MAIQVSSESNQLKVVTNGSASYFDFSQIKDINRYIVGGKFQVLINFYASINNDFEKDSLKINLANVDNQAGWLLTVAGVDQAVSDISSWKTLADGSTKYESIVFKGSDETTALTVGDGKITVFAHCDMTITDVFAGLSVLGTTSGTTTIDIELNGTSIFTTNLLTIDFGEATSLTALTPANITTTSISKGDKVVMNIDTITSGATEAGIQVVINGTRV